MMKNKQLTFDLGLPLVEPTPNKKFIIPGYGGADYEEWIKIKRERMTAATSDETYTPPPVYESVKKWVNDNILNLDGMEVLRPFYTNGDFINEYYPANAVVLDNPPFSIIKKIVRFYTHHSIPFFLFCDARTCFNLLIDGVGVVLSQNITYANGVTINTAFASNMLGDVRVIARRNVIGITRERRKKIPKPRNVLGFNDCVRNGLVLTNDDIKGYDSKNFFGWHIIVNDHVADLVEKNC